MIDTYSEEVRKYGKEMEVSELEKYVNKLFRFLMKMVDGQIIPIKNLAEPETTDLFKAVVKMYIDETPYCPIEFTNDYLNIKKKLI